MKRSMQILFLFVAINLAANPGYKSPFNDKGVLIDSTGNYSFIVSGHFYGDRHNKSGYPANTLLGNLDWMNSSGAAMLVCLGDLFADVSNDIPKYETALFDQLEIPLVNAVGNHDLSGNIYQENFGKTNFWFKLNQDIHLIIDTEMSDGDIEGEQLELFLEIKKLVVKGDVSNVFIYSHRTVWSKAYEEMEGLFSDNTQSLIQPNFKAEILPLLNEMSQFTNVFWFSGSLGTAPASFFYFDDTKNGVKIIATAIRTLPRDAMLMVNVVNGNVTFQTHSLTGEELLELEEYDIDYWQDRKDVKEPFNWRLVPLYFKQTLLHRYFWYGILSAIITFSAVLFVYRRRNRRKKE